MSDPPAVDSFTTPLGSRHTLTITVERDASISHLEAQARDELRSLVAACAEAREKLTRWMEDHLLWLQTMTGQVPPPTPNWMPGAPLPTGAADDCISATVPADPVVALTAAEDAAATPPPPPALLPASRSAFRGRSRSPIGRAIANLNVLAEGFAVGWRAPGPTEETRP